MATGPNLSTTFTADQTQMVEALNSLTKALEVAKSKAIQNNKEVGESFKKEIGAGISDIQNKLMALYAASKLKDSFDSVLEISKNVKSLSLQLGLSANQAGVYSLALNRMGNDSETFLNISAKLVARMKKNSQDFAANGIDLNQGGKLKATIQVLGDIVTKYDSLEGSQTKAKFGNDVLGRGFMTNIPIIRQFLIEVDNTNAVMQKFGIAIDWDKIQSGVKEYKKNWNDYNQIVDILKIKIGNELLPALTKFAAFLANTVGNNINDILSVVKTLAIVLSNGFAAGTVAALLFAKTLKSLWVALSMNPIAAVISGIVALALAIDYLSTSQERANKAQAEHTETLKNTSRTLAEAKKSLADYGDQFVTLSNKQKAAGDGSKDYLSAQKEIDKIANKLINTYPELNGYLKIENGHVTNLGEALKKLNDQKEREYEINTRLLRQNLEKTEQKSISGYQELLSWDKHESSDYKVGRAYNNDGSFTPKGSGIMGDITAGKASRDITATWHVSTRLIELMKQQAIDYKAYMEARAATNTVELAKAEDGGLGSDKEPAQKFGVKLAHALNLALSAAAKDAESKGLVSFDQTQAKADFLALVASGGAKGLKAVSGEDKQELRARQAEVTREQAEKSLKIKEATLKADLKEADTLEGQIKAQEKLVALEGDPLRRVEAQAKLNELKVKQAAVEVEIADIHSKMNAASRISQLDIDEAEVKALSNAKLISGREELKMLHTIFLEKLRIKELDIDSQIAIEKDPKKKATLQSQKAGIGNERASGNADYAVKLTTLDQQEGKDFKGFFTSIKNDLKKNVNVWEEWGSSVKSVYSTLKTSMATNLSSMMKGNQTFGQSAKAMWSSVANSALDSLSQMMVASMEAQAMELLFGETKAAVATQAVAADQMEIASTQTKTAVDATETGTGIIASIAKIFSAHASIPFVGPLIAIGLIALMMAAFKSNSSQATARAKGGVAGLNGPEYTVLGDAGKPEWVLPEDDFKSEFRTYTTALLTGDMKALGLKNNTLKSTSGIKTVQPIQVNVNAPNGIIGDLNHLQKYLSRTLNSGALRGVK
jgi:hypothetical protein